MESDKDLPKKDEQSTGFHFPELTAELRYIIADVLSDKDLLNLRSTSKENRELIDGIILRPDNLTRLFNKFTINQAISFINGYLMLYKDDFANKVQDHLVSYLNQLSFNEIIDVLTQLGNNATLDKVILNYLNNVSMTFDMLLNCDQTHLSQFAHQFPNLFQDEMNQPDAPLLKRLIYILTVEDVHKLTPAFMRETLELLNEYRTKNPALLNAKLGAFISSMGMQGKLAEYLHHEHYQKTNEPDMARYAFYFDLNPGFVNLKKVNLSFNSWYFDAVNTSIPPNFSEANLLKSCFSGNLTQFVFIRANLLDAKLIRTNLTNANLSHANLTGADLSDSNLTNTNLSHANLTGADLSGTNLTNTNLSDANLTGVKFLNPKFFQNKELLTHKLFQLYDMIEDHPQFREIIKALAAQIHSYTKTLAQKDPNLAKALLDAALHHGIFRRSDPEKTVEKKPTLQPDIYKKPPKPESSAEIKQLEELYLELEKKHPSQKPPSKKSR